MNARAARHPQVRDLGAEWHRFWLDGLGHVLKGDVCEDTFARRHISLGGVGRDSSCSCRNRDQQMSAANPEPRHPGEGEGSVRQSSQLDQLRLPLVLTVEEAADRLGVGRTLMYSLVSSGAIESVRIGRLRRVPADALVTFLDELRRDTGAGAG